MGNQEVEPPGGVDSSINSGTAMLPVASVGGEHHAGGTRSLTSAQAEEQRDTAILAVAEQKLARPLDAYVREYATFNCRCGLNLGKLVIHPSGLRFESLRKRRTIWDRAWMELVEIKKVWPAHLSTHTAITRAMRLGHGLSLVTIGEELRARGEAAGAGGPGDGVYR